MKAATLEIHRTINTGFQQRDQRRGEREGFAISQMLLFCIGLFPFAVLLLLVSSAPVVIDLLFPLLLLFLAMIV